MKITTDANGIRVLTPTDGMYLFNGSTYSQLVYLGKNASPEDWVEVSEKPEVQEDTEEATTEDYEAALAEMGVGV